MRFECDPSTLFFSRPAWRPMTAIDRPTPRARPAARTTPKPPAPAVGPPPHPSLALRREAFCHERTIDPVECLSRRTAAQGIHGHRDEGVWRRRGIMRSASCPSRARTVDASVISSCRSEDRRRVSRTPSQETEANADRTATAMRESDVS